MAIGLLAAFLLWTGRDDALNGANASSNRNGDDASNRLGNGTNRSAARALDAGPSGARSVTPSPSFPASYESAHDLYDFYMKAKGSSNPAIVYQAYRAYIECQSLGSNADRFRNAFSGGDSAGLQGTLTSQRWSANDELLKRCNGFERLGERGLDEAGKSLRERMSALGSVEAQLDVSDTATSLDDATLQKLLQAHTSSAFDRAIPTLAESMRNTMGVSAESEQAAHIEIALNLASCDLGGNCLNTSYRSLVQCAYYDACDKPLGYDWQAGLSSDQIAWINQLKERIVKGAQDGTLGTSAFK